MALTQVSTGGIKNATVATEDIANGAVSNAKIVDGAINNAKVVSDAAIAGSKISPSFTANTTITAASPVLRLADSTDPVGTDGVVGKLEFYGSDGSSGGADVRSFIQTISTNSVGNAHALTIGLGESNNAPTEKIRILGDGKVGIGATSIDRLFHVEGTDNVLGKFQNDQSICLIEFEDTDTTAGNRPSIGSDGNEFVMYTGGGEKLRVDNNGNLGIGTQSPGRRLVLAGDTDTVVSVTGATNGTSNLFLGDTDDDDIGALTYNHVSNFLSFTANASERMRIDSSGNLQFRTASTSHQGLEWYYNNSKNLSFTFGDNNANPTLNIYRADAQTGFPYGSLIINTGDGSNPTQALKLRTDKNIELAGNLIMASGKGMDFSATSGSGTSELLDDYEEGTFDAINNYNTVWYSNQNACTYTKIGRQVTVTGQIRAYSGTGDYKLGLPFSVASNSGSESEFTGVGALGIYDQNTTGTPVSVHVLANGGDSFCYFMESFDNGAWNHLETDADAYLRFTFTYFTS